MSELVVFIAPPGAGKGTVSAALVERYGWAQLSTGDLCRKHIAEQTEVGKAIDFAIKSGKLVSDGLIMDMVGQWVMNEGTRRSVIILDGVPRTIAQVQALYALLKVELSHYTLKVFRFFVSHNEIIKRLSSRLICGNTRCQSVFSNRSDGSVFASRYPMVCDVCSHELVRRADDAPEAIEKRLMTYAEHEKGLLNFYAAVNQPIYMLDAEKPLDKVLVEFEQLMMCARQL